MPFGRRDRLTSAVGPDGSGSNPGSGCTQMPEKSGMDAALSLLRDWRGGHRLREGGRHDRRRKREYQREIPPPQIHCFPPLFLWVLRDASASELPSDPDCRSAAILEQPAHVKPEISEFVRLYERRDALDYLSVNALFSRPLICTS